MIYLLDGFGGWIAPHLRQGQADVWWVFDNHVLGTPLAALGMPSSVIAAAAMVFSSVSVVINSLTLRH